MNRIHSIPALVVTLCCWQSAEIRAESSQNRISEEEAKCVPLASANDIDLRSADAFEISDIQIVTRPIFDESDPNTIALHRWANALHIVTKPEVVRERLLFDVGDLVTKDDIQEAEAVLRNERYLANADIDISLECDSTPARGRVKVTTYDNWSLIPTLSFSRSGGENAFIIGARDDNLFGLGIRSRLRYSDDEQRSGYQLSFSSAVPWIRHSNIHLSLADNDDGERYQLVFDKPFYHLTTQRSHFAEFLHDQRIEDIFQSDLTRNSFAVESERYQVATGWRLASDSSESHRISVGFTFDQSLFSLDETSPSSLQQFVPADRRYRFPWIAYEYIARDIAVLRDIYLIQQPEDINLGWHYRFLLGAELHDLREDGDLGYHLQAFARKGYQFGETLLLFNAAALADINTTAKDRVQLDVNGEYFYRLNTAVGLYARLSGTFSSGQFLDDPIVVDDSSGVRGYANQYQHGDHRISASAEVRWYTGYNFYKLFDVGFAGFVDAGRAFNGEFSALNEDDGVLSSVGVGARFYSNRSSNRGVVHLDFATPLSDGESVDSWEWSIQMRRTF